MSAVSRQQRGWEKNPKIDAMETKQNVNDADINFAENQAVSTKHIKL